MFPFFVLLYLVIIGARAAAERAGFREMELSVNRTPLQPPKPYYTGTYVGFMVYVHPETSENNRTSACNFTFVPHPTRPPAAPNLGQWVANIFSPATPPPPLPPPSIVGAHLRIKVRTRLEMYPQTFHWICELEFRKRMRGNFTVRLVVATHDRPDVRDGIYIKRCQRTMQEARRIIKCDEYLPIVEDDIGAHIYYCEAFQTPVTDAPRGSKIIKCIGNQIFYNITSEKLYRLEEERLMNERLRIKNLTTTLKPDVYHGTVKTTTTTTTRTTAEWAAPPTPGNGTRLNGVQYGLLSIGCLSLLLVLGCFVGLLCTTFSNWKDSANAEPCLCTKVKKKRVKQGGKNANSQPPKIRGYT